MNLDEYIPKDLYGSSTTITALDSYESLLDSYGYDNFQSPVVRNINVAQTVRANVRLTVTTFDCILRY